MPRPDKDEIDRILCERHTPEIHNVIIKAKIGIAGLGGLGSNIAAMLIRAGVSDLIIADHDVVEISNINRQNYCMDQKGMAKTDATEQQLMRINPFVRIKTHNIKLDRTNISDVFGKCDVVCEAFDIPSEKAMLINCLLEECPGIKIVAGSGMAGYGRSNEITTKKLFTDLYICGDGIDMEDAIGGLMSPRVNICAGHMANAVISILLEGDV